MSVNVPQVFDNPYRVTELRVRGFMDCCPFGTISLVSEECEHAK